MGQKISTIQADLFLEHDFEDAEQKVKKVVLVPLSPQQLGALTSFVFNLGAGALKVSTLLKKLNQGDYRGAAEEFIKWVYTRVNGKPIKMNGLIKRRAAERELFLK